MKTIVLACLLVSSVAVAEGPPGQIVPGATVVNVCTPGWAAQHRNVRATDAVAAYKRQGLARDSGPCVNSGCVVDHDVALELGGNSSLANLRVQTRAESLVKDKIENFLHREVCAGRLPLDDAQWLVKNWRYLRPPALATPIASP